MGGVLEEGQRAILDSLKVLWNPSWKTLYYIIAGATTKSEKMEAVFSGWNLTIFWPSAIFVQNYDFLFFLSKMLNVQNSVHFLCPYQCMAKAVTKMQGTQNKKKHTNTQKIREITKTNSYGWLMASAAKCLSMQPEIKLALSLLPQRYVVSSFMYSLLSLKHLKTLYKTAFCPRWICIKYWSFLKAKMCTISHLPKP